MVGTRLVCVLLLSLVVSGRLIAEEALTNAKIIAMTKAGLKPNVIVAQIEKLPGRYIITPDALITLKTAGVADDVIDAMTAKIEKSSTNALKTQTPDKEQGQVHQTANGAWKTYDTVDPLDGSTSYESSLRVGAEGANGTFEVKATCGTRLSLSVVYLETYNGAAVEYLKRGSGYSAMITVVSAPRLSLDSRLYPLDGEPMTFGNETSFSFPDYLDDSSTAKAHDIADAKTVQIELALSTGAKAIMSFHPTDPEFKRFTARCLAQLDSNKEATTPPTQAALNAWSQIIRSSTGTPASRPSSSSPNRPDNPIRAMLDSLKAGPDPNAPPKPQRQLEDRPIYTTPIPKQPNATPDPSRPVGGVVDRNLAVLTIHSGLPGQPNPLGRTHVGLMANDFNTTLFNVGIRVPDGLDPRGAFRKLCKGDADCEYKLSRASVDHGVVGIVTDPNGDATLTVKPGEYYIRFYSHDQQRLRNFWDEKVTLHPGANSFTVTPGSGKPVL